MTICCSRLLVSQAAATWLEQPSRAHQNFTGACQRPGLLADLPVLLLEVAKEAQHVIKLQGKQHAGLQVGLSKALQKHLASKATAASCLEAGAEWPPGPEANS